MGEAVRDPSRSHSVKRSGGVLRALRPSSSGNQEVSLAEFVFRHRRCLIGVTLAALLTGIGVSVVYPRTYRSRAVVELRDLHGEEAEARIGRVIQRLRLQHDVGNDRRPLPRIEAVDHSAKELSPTFVEIVASGRTAQEASRLAQDVAEQFVQDEQAVQHRALERELEGLSELRLLREEIEDTKADLAELLGRDESRADPWRFSRVVLEERAALERDSLQLTAQTAEIASSIEVKMEAITEISYPARSEATVMRPNIALVLSLSACGGMLLAVLAAGASEFLLAIRRAGRVIG
jgi:hypothetical protein